MITFLALTTVPLLLLGFGALYRRTRRRAVGPAAVGMVYDFLNQDRRNAVEVIVEGRAEERDSEHADDPGPKRKAAKKR
jgi:hypothetical protein